MRPIETLLARLEGAREVPGGYLARCPCSDHGRDGQDSHPSLSVTEGRDGRVLVKCQVGCRTEDVLDALHLTWADLFPNRDSGSGGRSRRRSQVRTPERIQVNPRGGKTTTPEPPTIDAGRGAPDDTAC